jgi:prevent-host-death family protein
MQPPDRNANAGPDGDRAGSSAGAFEVTMNELDRHAARVVREVASGRAAVVTRNGEAVAMVVPLAEVKAGRRRAGCRR